MKQQMAAKWLAPLALALALAFSTSHAGENMDGNMDSNEQAIPAAQKLIDLHFEIWNDANPANWAPKYPAVYAKDFFVADYSAKATGYEAVTKLQQKLRSEHPGFIFTPDPLAWNHGIGRVTWGYGPKDQPNLIRGEDIFTIEGGKLASARVFIDKK